ncbi:MFS transporter [Brevibacillus choshinensis]|uniref:MFS transporter n=1 Tax=Brevibacillus choshinensis TaxID=54911 RepID=A0ABX7FJ18_BRECH|nr:MFS transporter [Brevibacillus choshinensis]QRG65724.1 MFS transporter [Brevibacillus choshinensis]
MATTNERSHANGQQLILVLMFTMTISSMSAMMFNLALPAIREQFGLTLAQTSWVSSLYMVIYAIGTVIYGKLADSIKLKSLVTFGLLLFAGGSLVGIFSQTFWMVLAGRCLQAMGAAAIPATAGLIPVRYMSPERRGAAIGTAMVGLALGGVLGPVISALVLHFTHWRYLFSIPLFVLILLPLYRRYLGEEASSPAKVDWTGGGMLSATVVLLVLSLTNRSGWMLAAGMVALGVFIKCIRTVENPFIQPRLFRSKSYTFGIIMMLFISGSVTSLSFLCPLLLTQVQHLSPGWVGLAMVPAAAAQAIFGRRAGKLADRRGNAYVFTIASGLLLFSFALLSTFIGASPMFIAAFLIFGNVGQMCMVIAMSNAISSTLPKEQVGIGIGILQMTNFIMFAVASAVYSSLLDLGGVAKLNLANGYVDGAMYSNIFFVLALIQAALLIFYRTRFVKMSGESAMRSSWNGSNKPSTQPPFFETSDR